MTQNWHARSQLRGVGLEEGRPEATIVELGTAPRKTRHPGDRPPLGNLVALDLVDDFLGNTTPKRVALPGPRLGSECQQPYPERPGDFLWPPAGTNKLMTAPGEISRPPLGRSKDPRDR